jgi:integrase
MRVERRTKERVARAGRITFAQFAREYVDDRRAEWKSAKHASQWLDSLDAYAKPIMKKALAAISYPDVLACLKPHWLTKTETASRVQGRISNIMDRAVAKGLRPDNPAKWDLLKHDLSSASALKRQKVKHFAALPAALLPELIVRLRKRQGITPMALEFLILTCARVNEVVGMVDAEVDFAAKVWKVPAERMKGGREHNVPLCERALHILKTVPREKDNQFIFASGAHASGHITNAALYKLTVDISDTLGHKSTVHGFRATFRTWASESTRFPHAVVELALAHAQPDPLVRAYQRSDLLVLRRKLAEQWATYALTPQNQRKVVPMTARSA